MGGLSSLFQKGLEGFGRDPHGTPQAAGPAALVDAAALEPAAQVLDNAADRLLGGVEFSGFHGDVSGVDQLCVGGEDTAAASVIAGVYFRCSVIELAAAPAVLLFG